jgi:hypothetical protein
MPELLERHKRFLSPELYLQDQPLGQEDVAPSIDSAATRAFAADLSSQPPEIVPLRDVDQGLYGWPAVAVRQRIAEHGGSIRFGWRLREWPGVLLTAEFHCVWVDPDGASIDITPTPVSGSTTVFVPDPAYAEDFDDSQRPAPRYKVLHVAPDWSEAVAERIAALKPPQRAYEERRAQKAGKPLEEWMLRKFPADPIPKLLDLFIAASLDYEAKLSNLADFITVHASAPETDALRAAPESDAPDAEAEEYDEVTDECAAAADNVAEWSRRRIVAYAALLIGVAHAE